MRVGGFKNIYTWSVCLYVDNERHIYDVMRYEAKYNGEFTAESARSFVEARFPSGTPDMESKADFNQVDWQEVADHFNSE